jgi:hypothetical protein
MRKPLLLAATAAATVRRWPVHGGLGPAALAGLTYGR